MKRTLNVIINPSISCLTHIDKWISQFKLHRGLIIQAFKTERLIVISKNDEITGYLTYRTSGKIAYIDLLEIKASNRGKGLGERLVRSSLSRFSKQGIRIVEILSRPRSSENFWRKMGFTTLPASTNFDPDELKLYCILGKSMNVYSDTIDNCKVPILELYNEEPHLAKECPNWRWQLKCKAASGYLVEPIVAPCHADWKIRLVHGGETIREHKIKYFTNKPIDFSGYLIIETLSELDI